MITRPPSRAGTPYPRDRYVLVTAARNEEQYIEKTIQAIINQTILPREWVIVSDGSTDATDQIVRRYGEQYGFIKLLRKEKAEGGSGFASKVQAIRKGVRYLQSVEFDYIGHLDADITLGEEYYSLILHKFKENPQLGIAGGFIYEKANGRFKSRPLNVKWSVAGGIQLFRRQCYLDIGGLQPLKLGGEDWHAETMARMRGWQVESFPEVPAYHHKPSSKKRGFVKECIREGAMDYALGTHPLFEIIKSARRVLQKPYVIYATIRFFGFILSYINRRKRPVTDEFKSFLRTTQIERLKKQFIR